MAEGGRWDKRVNVRGGRKFRHAYRILLLSQNLTWRLEVDAKNGVFAFVCLADVFDGIDVEGYGAARDGKNDCIPLFIDVYPAILDDRRQLILPLVTLILAENLGLVVRATLLAMLELLKSSLLDFGVELGLMLFHDSSFRLVDLLALSSGLGSKHLVANYISRDLWCFVVFRRLDVFLGSFVLQGG